MLGFTFSALSDTLPVYSCLKLKLTLNLFVNHAPWLKWDETCLVYSCWSFHIHWFPNVRLCLMGVYCQKFWGSLIIKNKTQTAVINMVSFHIFINLTFRVIFNIHFQKWFKVTVEDNDGTIYTKIYKGSGNDIKNSKFLTITTTKGNTW